MPRTAKQNEDKMNRMLNGWKKHAPTKTYGGMTLAEFETLIENCMQPRIRLIEIAEEDRQQEILIKERDAGFLEKAEFIVAGVIADPEAGSNSALYESFGYVRKEDRRSGLTRRSKPEPVKKE